METYFPILLKCPLFQHIKKEQLSKLLSCLGAFVKHYTKKETILSEGSSAKYLGIVLSGSVQMIQIDYFGNRSIIAYAEPSELFAESFACAGVSAIPFSVIANEACEVLLIDCQRMMHSCSNACNFHQQMLENLLGNIALKNIQFHQKLEILSKRSTREKLMAYLILQAKKANSPCFEIPFNRQELADYLETDRSGLSTEISKLQKQGILKTNKKQFTLLSNRKNETA